MNLQVQQQVMPHDEGWWDWTVWIDGPQNELDEVEYVEYILHPTFPNPVQKVTDRGTNFRLQRRGWGEFNIKVRVYLEDDEVIVLDHWLELDDIASARERESLSGTRSDIKTGKQSRLYLSSAVADMEFAYTLKDALEDEGIDVLMNQDLEDEQSLSVILETERRSFQAGLFVISDVRNPWLIRDYWALAESKISTLVVQIGEPQEIPEELRDQPRFQIKDVSESEQVASSIARRVQDQL